MADTTTRRVVVTGLGATTPLGGDVPTTWQALLDGTSGATPLTQPWAERYELPVTFAAQLAVRPVEVLAKVETRRLDPSAQYALIAAREAWADAGSPELDGDRLGVVVASGIGAVWPARVRGRRDGGRVPRALPSPAGPLASPAPSCSVFAGYPIYESYHVRC